jgi:hypothetical protein
LQIASQGKTTVFILYGIFLRLQVQVLCQKQIIFNSMLSIRSTVNYPYGRSILIPAKRNPTMRYKQLEATASSRTASHNQRRVRASCRLLPEQLNRPESFGMFRLAVKLQPRQQHHSR